MIKISRGRSQRDRISFYTDDNGATAIRDENGKITFAFEEKDESMKALGVLLGIFGLPSLVKAYVLIPLIEYKIIKTAWYLIPLFIYLVLMILGIIFTRKDEGKEFLKNHGAEHKVFNAYKKLGIIPTVEEANQFSRISKYCGVTVFSSFITTQLIGYIVYFNTSYIISELIIFLVAILFPNFFPFNLIGKLAQFFTTSKPERKNIELAIAALDELEHKELPRVYF